MEHFVNSGYGWTCRRCGAREAAREGAGAGETRGRFFGEGEAEVGGTPLASESLARWRDSSQSARVCPRCGVEETFDGGEDARTLGDDDDGRTLGR
ncbi:MAG TPA: hypothetical protein VEQ42_13975 [Pyrinomonadaceae bacterium]|nr:hypothetical protein [Pyrinomonadaceae bacterium]